MDLYFSPLACSMATRIALYEADSDASFLEVDPKTKRVLQDKRFKVFLSRYFVDTTCIDSEFARTVSFRLCALSTTPTSFNSRPSITPTANALVSPTTSRANATHADCFTERRSISQSGARICPRDRLPSFAILQQDEDYHACPRSQALYLSAVPCTCLYPLSRHLSS